MLDDLAQIVGPSLRCVREVRSIKSALHRRSAVLMAHHGCICAAESLSELHAAAMVVEKGCRALIESSFVGGGRRISFPDALLMRIIYRFKYRKMAGS